MKFDNSDFEKNVKTSQSTIENLKNSLGKLKDSKTGLEDLNSSVKGLNFEGLSTSVQNISDKFSTLGIIGVTALQNIINKAVDAGTQLMKSLTIDQITAGFSEYELKMGSIQTIMASTGASMNVVKGYLEELNKYADQTIYSFSDMTSNIGKFTNAGVELSTAVDAMKGISNWAAVSGATSQQNSQAMYNIAQSLAGGYMQLIDWKSVKVANMATQDVMKNLLETAEIMGTVKKNADGMYDSLTTNNKGKVAQGLNTINMFNEGLQYQWLTTDVLMETFSHYANNVEDMTEEEKKAYEEKLKGIGYTEEQIVAIEELGKKANAAATDVKTFSMLMDTLKEAVGSNWAMTFEYIFGDFEQAKALWSKVNESVSEIIENIGGRRNELLKGWNELGGRDYVINGIAKIWNNLLNIVKSVSEAFREVFPATTVENLVKISYQFSQLMSKISLTTGELEYVKRTFKGLFAILDIGKQALTGVWHGLKNIFTPLKDGASSVLELTASWGDWLVALDESIKEAQTFEKIGERLGNVIKVLAEFVGDFFDNAKVSFAEGGGGLAGGLEVIFDKVVDLIRLFGDLFNSITGLDSSGVIDFIVTPIQKARDIIVDFVTDFGGTLDKIKEHFKNVVASAREFGDGVHNVFADLSSDDSVGFFASVIETMWNVVKKLADILGGTLLKVIDAVVAAFSRLDLNTIIGMLNTGILVDLVTLVKNVLDPLGDFGEAIQNIKEDLAVLEGALKAFTANIKADTLLKIAAGLLMMAISLEMISSIPGDQLAAALGVVTVALGELVGSMILLEKFALGSKWSLGNLINSFALKNIGSLVIKFAAAVAILAVAMKLVSDIDPNRLAASWGVITALLIEIAGISAVLSKTKPDTFMKGATGLIAMSLAVAVLAKACGVIAEVPAEDLWRSVGAITVLMGVMTLFAKLLSNNSLSKGFGKNSFKATSEIADNMIQLGIGMIAIAAAVKILASAAKDFAELKWEELGKAGAAIGSILLATGLIAKLPGDPKGMIQLGIGMIAIAAAMEIFADAAVELAKMDWGQLGKAGAAIGAILLAVGLIAKLPGNNTNLVTIGIGLIGVAAAMEIFANVAQKFATLEWGELGKAGVAIGALLGAILVFAKFTDAGDLLTTSGALIVFAAGLAILTPALKALGSMQLSEVGIAVLALAGAFTVLGVAGLLLGPLVPAILGLAGAFALIGVGVAALGVGLIAVSAGLTALAAVTVVTAESIVRTLGTLLVGVVKILGEVIVAAVEQIVNSADALVTGVVTLVKVILESIRQCVPDIVETILYLADEALKSFAAHAGSLADSLVSIIIDILRAITDRLPDMTSVLSDFISGIIDQIIEIFRAIIGKAGDVIAAIGEEFGKIIGSFIGGLMDGFTNAFDIAEFGTELSNFMENLAPFIKGSKDIDESSMRGLKSLAEAILVLTAADVIDGLTSWFTGGSSLAEFGDELAKFGPKYKKYADSIKGIDSNVVEASANAAKSLASFAEAIPNEGGLVAKFTGDNSLSTFADELVKFGPSFKTYAESVSGIDAGDVESSANAAKAVAAFAEEIPNAGGLVSLFTGDNSLTQFGEDLAAFGPNFKTYANSVEGIDAGVVEASANMAKSLIAMAEDVPNTDGLISWFTGNNDLETFGTQLASFGTSFATYSKNVETVDPEVVNKTTAAAQSLVTLNSSLGTTEWGDLEIDTFGAKIAAFGEYFLDYYNQISGIGVETIDGITSSVNGLTFMCANIGLVDSEAITTFGESIADLGENIAEGIEEMVDTDVTGFTNAIISILNALSLAITENGEVVQDAFRTLFEQCIVIIDAFGFQFNSAGGYLMSNLITGIGSYTEAVKTKCRSVVNNALTGIKDYYSNFVDAGKYLMQGLYDGMDSKQDSLYSLARSIGENITTIINAALDEHSPSRITYESGANVDFGLINGMDDNASRVYASALAVGTAVKDAIQYATDMIEDDIDAEPVIRPIMDLSDVENGVVDLSGILGNQNGVKMRVNAVSAAISSANDARLAATLGDTPNTVNNTYNFNQTNNSPKALSRIDIYRQTKNQFSMMKGMVSS